MGLPGCLAFGTDYLAPAHTLPNSDTMEHQFDESAPILNVSK